MLSTNYVEVTASRDLQGTAFSKGAINFPWNFDNSTYFNPYRSFLKMRVKITDQTGLDRLDAALTIAPAMFIGDCFWQSERMKINDKYISELGDYVAQSAALKHRMYTSEEEQSNWGETTNMSQASIYERASVINHTGNTHLRYTSQITDLSIAFTLNEDNGARGETDNYTIANGAIAGESTLTLTNATLLDPLATIRAGDQLIFHGYDDIICTIVRIIDDENLEITPRLVEQAATAYVIGDISYVPQILGSAIEARNKKDIELFYKPPLGFFDIDSFVPCCNGNFVLEMTPHPENIYKSYVIESWNEAVPGNHYDVSVERLSLWLLVGQGPPISKNTIELDFREIRCQSQQLFSNNLSQKTFQVHPRADALTVAYQSPLALTNDTRESLTKFINGEDDQEKIRIIYIKFGNKQLPSPIPDLEFDVETDYLTHRYIESIMYANAVRNCEPYSKWLERGPYYHFAGFSNQDKEGRCYVSQQFDDFDAAEQLNVLLFDHFDKKIKLGIENGMLQMVGIDD